MTLAATIVAGPSSALAYGAAGVAVLMLVLWAISIRIRDVSIIDPAWGPAFVIVALAGALAGDGCPGRRWLVLAMTALWGLRLGGYLLARKLLRRLLCVVGAVPDRADRGRDVVDGGRPAGDERAADLSPQVQYTKSDCRHRNPFRTI